MASLEDCKQKAKELRRAFTTRPTLVRKLAQVVASGDLKAAWKHYCKMDTYDRDGIPGGVWSFLYENRTKGKIVVSFVVKCEGKVFQEGTLTFPSDAPNNEIAAKIVRWESVQRNNLLIFEYGPTKKTRK